MTGQVFKVVCAWCNRTVTAGPGSTPITHTICPRCLDLTVVHPGVQIGFEPFSDEGHFHLPAGYFGDGFKR